MCGFVHQTVPLSIFLLVCLFMKELFHSIGTVNPSKCGCPFALKMAACQLLLEITTFLRETFSCLPRPRTEPLVVSKAWVLIIRLLREVRHVARFWVSAISSNAQWPNVSCNLKNSTRGFLYYKISFFSITKSNNSEVDLEITEDSTTG